MIGLEPESSSMEVLYFNHAEVKCFEIVERLRESGCDGRIVSIDHLSELKEDIESLQKMGLLHQPLCEEYLSDFTYGKPRSLPSAKSIIVISIPQPTMSITFHYRGESINAVIPPVYAEQKEATPRAAKLLRRSAPMYKFFEAKVPLKSLAVHSRLALYGRNNITYTRDFGSSHRLVAFITDHPIQEEQWRQLETLPKCRDCQLCFEACPTGAISKERFLIKAERYITYYNEKHVKYSFPQWLNPLWHNAIVGRMRCQTVCPYNIGVLDWCERKGESHEIKASKIGRRLQKAGLDLTIFPRNLEYLLKKEVREMK
ncbi:MAG: 4Fe-4S double cluster binding domain-containing protein [Nitrososphaeria archaeon]